MPEPADESATTFGQSGVMWVVATAEKPLTAAEIAERAPCTVDSVRSAATRCFRCGYLLRRLRVDTGRGTNPYEYTIRPRDDDDAVDFDSAADEDGEGDE